jgi:hypothetical protein
MAGKNAAAAAIPDDLSTKRSALAAVQAEVKAEGLVDENGAILVTLSTRLGFHDMRVPPMTEWTSVARHALQQVPSDDLTWAVRTLSQADALKWMQLDPTGKESQAFFHEWSRKLGMSLGE